MIARITGISLDGGTIWFHRAQADESTALTHAICTPHRWLAKHQVDRLRRAINDALDAGLLKAHVGEDTNSTFRVSFMPTDAYRNSKL